MSIYTTEVRFICELEAGYDGSQGYKKVDEIINEAKGGVFDFDFPIFDESYRGVLEHKILKHYYTREIGAETVGLWKLWLNRKMNEIMPYYNKLYESELIKFNPLETKNISRVGKREIDGNKDSLEGVKDLTQNTVGGTVDGDSTRNVNSNYNQHDSGISKYSDTPQGTVERLANDTYLTNATITGADGTGDNHSNDVVKNRTVSKTNGTTDYARDKSVKDEYASTEEYLETISGFDSPASDMLMKFRQTFLNIDMLIIDELADLFFGLW